MRYEYFEKDGATFRRAEGFAGANEIKFGGKWVPSTGDRMAPVTFGYGVTPAEAGEIE